MMLYPAMNKLTANVPNRYLLVNVVARRARQIAQEAEDNGETMDVKPVTIAINEAREMGFLGKDIFGTGFNFDLDIRLGAGAFVCSEETALMTSI